MTTYPSNTLLLEGANKLKTKRTTFEQTRTLVRNLQKQTYRLW